MRKIKKSVKLFLKGNKNRSKFKNDFERFKILKKTTRRSIDFELTWENILPIVNEATEQTKFNGQYTYFPAWAARKIKKINPSKHVDISSSLKFINVLSAFVPVDFYDFRPAPLKLDGLYCGQANLLKLPFDSDSIESLSCLHVVEHVGLGRYGDDIDYDGDLKAIKELKRVVQKGGSLLFVVPLGKPSIFYNAHRVYSKKMIVSYFDNFELKDFSLIPDSYIKDGMIDNASEDIVALQKNGCGCFWFVKE